MYQYEYETVSCDFGGWGFGSGNVYKIDDYRSIIERRAKDGWRYVGDIPIGVLVVALRIGVMLGLANGRLRIMRL